MDSSRTVEGPLSEAVCLNHVALRVDLPPSPSPLLSDYIERDRPPGHPADPSGQGAARGQVGLPVRQSDSRRPHSQSRLAVARPRIPTHPDPRFCQLSGVRTRGVSAASLDDGNVPRLLNVSTPTSAARRAEKLLAFGAEERRPALDEDILPRRHIPRP